MSSMSMQDSIGMFVEFNIEFAQSLPASGAVLSKNLFINGDEEWRIQCYPRGAQAGDEFLAVSIVNLGASRKNATIAFQAIVLHRANKHRPLRTWCNFDYPKNGQELIFPHVFRISDLAEHCVVNGFITLVCGLAFLQHSPIPLPPSSYARDLLPLRVKYPYGEPDVSFAVGDKLVQVNRKVLAARSPVFKAELDGSMAESTMPIVHPPNEFKDATFRALLWYVYEDRIPGESEVIGEDSMMELLRELLAAADWFAVDRLKLLCAKKLWEDVSVETVSKTFYYGDRYNCRELRNACIHYMAAADNMRRVAVTDEYVWLTQNFPSLIEGLRQRIMAEHI